jgi:hypothetical protein
VLLAVPLTAAIGVLVRFAWSATATGIYWGPEGGPAPRTAAVTPATPQLPLALRHEPDFSRDSFMLGRQTRPASR